VVEHEAVVYKRSASERRSDIRRVTTNKGGRFGIETVMVRFRGKARMGLDAQPGGQLPSEGAVSRKYSRVNGVPPG